MAIQLTGVQATLRGIERGRKNDAKNIAEGLFVCATVLYNKSQELVPVEYGPLKESGRVWQWGTGLGAKAAVIYETEYAVPVHEILDNEHTPPTQARYLSGAIPLVRGTMVARLKRQMLVGTRYQ